MLLQIDAKTAKEVYDDKRARTFTGYFKKEIIQLISFDFLF